MALEILSRSEAQTADVAGCLARLLEPGDIIFLIGQLGVGKTFFIRHAAQALGVAEPVTSPSFTMAQTYTSGPLRVHHLDLYRLSEFSTEDAIDFEEFFEKDAVTFVEWPERAERYFEEPDVVIMMSHVDLNSRRISIQSGNDRIMSGLGKLNAVSGD